MRRRDFLTGMAGSSGALAAAAAGSTTPIPMGLNTYCLRAMKWRDLELIDYVAGLKLDGIFLQDSLDPDVIKPEHWTQVRDYAPDHGLQRLEARMTTVEELGPYAVCVHLRDSVIYEHPRGVAVQWVPLGEGVVDFKKIVAKVREICPPVYIYIKPITGGPPAVLPYLEESFWTRNTTPRARDLARFVALAKKGRPYELPMVIEDI